MRVKNSQSFLSLYYEPGAVEIAIGSDQELPRWNGNTKSLGQVETPPVVAELMARWVMSISPSSILDPAVGRGGLLAACRTKDKHASLVGVEHDSETLHEAKKQAPRGTKLILGDYLFADAGQFAGIIANPPYVKAQRLSYSSADWRYFEERFGTSLDRLTNLYALFLLKIWEDLAPKGRAAVIIPAEFLNANFGEEIKERIIRSLRPAGIAIFSPEISIFADALTTSAIVFLEKGYAHTPLRAKKIESLKEAEAFVEQLLENPSTQTKVDYTDLASLRPRDKWLNQFFNDAPSLGHALFECRVGDYFKCSRGIATGANEFFCLTPSELLNHKLRTNQIDRCITKALDAEGLVFSTEKFADLEKRDRRCYLLNPPNIDPAVKVYLEAGELQGIPERHLPSHRPVWYRPENRTVAQIWVAVFSRENVKFILNTSGAKNLTCFHGLYAKKGFELIAPLLVLFLNSTWGQEAFQQVNRFYGGGLNKLEPKDVEAMACPKFPNLDTIQANLLIQELTNLELFPLSDRRRAVDLLITRYVEDLDQTKLEKALFG